jgi:hypothetical protein
MLPSSSDKVFSYFALRFGNLFDHFFPGVCMRSLVSLAVILAATSSLLDSAVYGESSLASDGLYCTAGLHPDGYIDFSGLPPATNIVNQQGQVTPSAEVTATLPVQGVAGLTATVTIPALYDNVSGSQPGYSVDGGTLRLNGLPQSGTSAVLTLAFNKPIVGVGLNTETSGRFEYTYTLQAGLSSGDTPPIFATTASGYTIDLSTPQTQSLQMLGLLNTSFQTASILFAGDEYANIALSNVRVQSTSAIDPASVVPTKGLQQWLRADQAQASLDRSSSGVWQDQSGRGHDATPSAIPPVLTADGRNCQPAWRFSGNQSFSFELPIAGWSEMTVFLVAKAANAHAPSNSFAGNSALSWTEDEPWGNTFVSPYQTNVYTRFGTTQTANTLYYSRPGGGIGQDFSTTRAVHDHGTDSLYVNGLEVESHEGKLSALGGTTGAGTIGAGIRNTFFHGEISEILVYDRVLSVGEAALVENYLGQKYGTR